jgi:uncharacterized protein (DUF433 family)
MLENLPSFLNRWEDGEIVLTGHRIGLYTIIRDHLERGMSAAEIQDYYPSLEPGLVEKVLEFYRARQPDVYDFYRDYKATLERQYEEWKNSPEGRRGPTREELHRRLAERGHTLQVDSGPVFDRRL